MEVFKMNLDKLEEHITVKYELTDINEDTVF